MVRWPLLLALVALTPALSFAARAQDHAGMDHGDMDQGDRAMDVDDQPGDAPPPAPPSDHAADRLFPADRMAAARAALAMHTRFTTTALQVDRLEYRTNKGKGGFGWETQGWYGGDIDRLVVASEGEGSFGKRAERIEVAGYWRHTLDPWFNLQLGLRHDLRPDPQRTYALIGIEGLAPYWFDVEAQLLVSDRGDVHARGKAGYQQRITQSLVLEPEAEVDFAFQDVPALNVAAGFERLELGARLRYERNRSLAPYLGVHWERRLGGTARLARASGEDASGVAAVLGLRALF
jgi:copper resistance protein B